MPSPPTVDRRTDVERAPFDGYIRVSRVGDRSGESYISPATQEKAIRDWTQRRGERLELNPPEENVSGGTMDRPILNAIMERIRSGESKGIVVYRLDRFARTLIGGYTALSELVEHGGEFASASEPQFDFTMPQGRLFLQLSLGMAEYFRELNKENWEAAARSAVERGVHVAPYGAFGYDRGADGRFTPNADAPFVQETFRLRGEQRRTWAAIAEWLQEVAPQPERMWTATAVQRLCARRIYLGEAFWSVNQNKGRRAPAINPNAHPGLVSPKLWESAQMDPSNAFGGPGNAKPSTPLPLLSGLIRCSGCRYLMSQGWAKTGEKTQRVYRCRRKHAAGRCPSPSAVIANNAEQYVEDAICDELQRLRPEFEGTSVDEEMAAALGALQDAQENLNAFRENTEAIRLLGDDWSTWLAQYVDAVSQAEQRIDALGARAEVGAHGLTAEALRSLPREEKQQVVRAFVDVVFLRPAQGGRGRHASPVSDRALILWKGTGPSDLPRPRRRGGPIQSFSWPDERELHAGVDAA
ncbi:MAG: recombinase family protein [Solirubrobacterales bacterium]